VWIIFPDRSITKEEKRAHPRDAARQKEWTDVYVECLGMETLAAESQQGKSERRNQF
jgi:hypothetical protein